MAQHLIVSFCLSENQFLRVWRVLPIVSKRAKKASIQPYLAILGSVAAHTAGLFSKKAAMASL